LKGNVEVLDQHKNSMPTPMLNEGHNQSGLGNQRINPDEEMINFLENKLENIERQLKQTSGSYEQLQSDYNLLQSKLNTSREKYKRAALLMTEFLHDILSDKANILTDPKTSVHE